MLMVLVVREMLLLLVAVNLLLSQAGSTKREDGSEDSDFGSSLVASLKNDANLDLSIDEEYEDLRAELLAYHTALASLSSNQNRRSMMTTPCWSLGGICIDYELCIGYRFLTEVPGCKDRLNVCCFTWNRFKVRDWRHKGIESPVMPWPPYKEDFGAGLGIVEKTTTKVQSKKKRHKKLKSEVNETSDIALLSS